MAAILVPVRRDQLARNVELPHGFLLGHTREGPWGVNWSDGLGVGETVFWVCWLPPQMPFRVWREGQEFVFFVEDASKDEVDAAPVAVVGREYVGR